MYASQDAKELPPTHAIMEDEALDMRKLSWTSAADILLNVPFGLRFLRQVSNSSWCEKSSPSKSVSGGK